MTALTLNEASGSAVNLQWYKRSIVVALVISGLIHLMILSMKKSDPVIEPKHLKAPLAVVLVNSQSQNAPVNPKRLAQHNLNGGGQQEAPMNASALSPMIPGLAEKLNTLQVEQNRLLSSLREDGSQQKKTTQGKTSVEKQVTDP